MQKVLVSACLLGEPVRYDGRAAPSTDPRLAQWRREGRVVPCCPELEGGLPVPRPPAELAGAAAPGAPVRILSASGEDLTAPFLAGARATVALCRKEGIQVAVLKERSPSCGSAWIHDGSFSGRLVPGRGIAAAALQEAGIVVFSEAAWEAAQARLAELEGTGAPEPGP